MLKDSDTLKSYNIENGSALHMVELGLFFLSWFIFQVQTKAAPGTVNSGTTQTTTQSTGTTQSNSQNTGIPTNLSAGGFGLLNQMGFGINLMFSSHVVIL